MKIFICNLRPAAKYSPGGVRPQGHPLLRSSPRQGWRGDRSKVYRSLQQSASRGGRQDSLQQLGRCPVDDPRRD